jgi:hypothetical protein
MTELYQEIRKSLRNLVEIEEILTLLAEPEEYDIPPGDIIGFWELMDNEKQKELMFLREKKEQLRKLQDERNYG